MSDCAPDGPRHCTKKINGEDKTFDNGAKICIEGFCNECVDGSWVKSDCECEPGQDGQPCSTEC
ncbi:MAG: hypothetical protein AAF628_38310 [Planctomycetota bacterium]